MRLETSLSNPPAPEPMIRYWLALDGARGLAVLLVLLDHASDAGLRLFPGADLNRAGKYGVYLFFVLSAFLLTSQFYARRPEELLDVRTWMNYAARRFLRIFPVYTVVIAAMIAMKKLDREDFATHLLLREGKRAFWTTPVEVKFYLLLPFIVFALFWAGRRHWAWGLAASVGAAAVAVAICLLERPWSLHKNIHLAPNLVPFLMGSAAAIAYGRLQRTAAAERWNPWLRLAAIAAALAILLRLPSLQHFVFMQAGQASRSGNDAVICGVLWSIFILGVIQGRGWLEAVLRWKPLRYLGLISFSAYLWHVKFLNDVDDLPVPSTLRLLAFLAIVIAVATASYFLLERPFLRLRPRRPASR